MSTDDAEHWHAHYDAALANWQECLATLSETRAALDELIKLQAHYAKLLNMHDGGQRHAFTSADEWIARLREVARSQSI